MTKEELEAFLIRKGFERTSFVTSDNYTIVDYYLYDGEHYLKDGFSLCFHDLDSYQIEFLMRSREGRDDYIIFDECIYIKYLTEEKFDEILSQYDKIKTALYMINQITKGE